MAREMVRVTKPGGRIVMGNWIPNDPTSFRVAVAEDQFGIYASPSGRVRQPNDLGSCIHTSSSVSPTPECPKRDITMVKDAFHFEFA